MAPSSGLREGATRRRPGSVLHRTLLVAALAAFAVVLLRTAWLCDDAYISFRTIRNFVAGDGLRWNLAERVQSYTHPLWVLLLSGVHALSGELYFTAIAVSLAVSMVAVAVVTLRLAPSPVAGVGLAVTLGSSQGFVDFSSSGLENPLTHLLLAAALVVFFATDARGTPRLGWLSLWAGLCAVNRLDTVLLTAPLLLYAVTRDRTRRGLLWVCVGFAPLLVWELFSLAYYGFPFPNTAYAKLPAEIDWASRLEKGGGFLASCVRWDPVAAVAIPMGALLPLALRRCQLVPLCAGSLLYVGYAVSVGGDFMAGRFLTAPLLLSVVAGSRAVSLASDPRWGLVPAVVAVALSLSLGPRSPWRTGADYGSAWHWRENIDERGVADERALYYPVTGLLRAGAALAQPWSPWFEIGSRVEPGGVKVTRTPGFMAFAAPRDAYFIDLMGLGDPLLARLAPKDVRSWRPGHLERALPEGYRETRLTGRNRIRDPWLATYFRELMVVTAAPLWSRRRAAAIWELNSGSADHLLQRHRGSVETGGSAPPP